MKKTFFFDNITKRYKIPWIDIWNLIFTSITGMVDQAVVIISEEFSLTDAQKAQANARRTAKHQVIYTERFSLIIWRLWFLKCSSNFKSIHSTQFVMPKYHETPICLWKIGRSSDWFMFSWSGIGSTDIKSRGPVAISMDATAFERLPVLGHSIYFECPNICPVLLKILIRCPVLNPFQSYRILKEGRKEG